MCGFSALVVKSELDDFKEAESIFNKPLGRGSGKVHHRRGRNYLFCHELLSTTGEREVVQPVEDHQFILLFNGFINNCTELEKKFGLESCQSDTEVIQKLLNLTDVIDLLRNLRGFFSIFIWDKKNRISFFTRDGSGAKPLFFLIDEEMLVLSSSFQTIKTYCNVGVDEELLYSSYDLFGFVPECVIKEASSIQPCKPGNIYTIDSDFKITENNLKSLGEHSNICDEEALEKTLSTHIRSFVDKVASDKVCIFLSSGVDSSLLSLFLREERVCGLSLVCGRDDRDSGRQFSTYLGSPHVDLNSEDHSFLGLKEKKILTEQFTSKDGLNMRFVSSGARSLGFRVALSGAGLDELCDGYGLKRKLLCFRFVSPFAACLKKIFKWRVLYILDYLPKTYLSSYLAARIWRKRSGPQSNDERVVKICYDELTNSDFFLGDQDCLDALPFWEQRFYLRDQLLRDSDVQGLSEEIDIRSPFCESEFYECLALIKLKNKDFFISILRKFGWKKKNKLGFFYGQESDARQQ